VASCACAGGQAILSERNETHPGSGQAGALVHLGVIDVGSNALRLQVASVFADGAFQVIHDEREPVRLGEEVFRTGELSAPAAERALETLKRFGATAQRHGASHVRAVATSAVREARNGAAFVEEVRKTSGLELEIISGEKEAQLIARGVLSGFSAPSGRIALVDIGGGSTEITVVDRGTIGFSGSIPLGSVRLTEAFCRSDPLSAEDERALREHVRRRLEAVLDPTRVPSCGLVVGSAGTIGALANFIRRRPSLPRLMRPLRTTFAVRELHRARAALCKMGLARRQKTRGIEERRSEIIVAGALLLEEICTHLKARSIKVVRRGLRDGLMLEEIERLGLVAKTERQTSAGKPAAKPAAS